MRAAWSIPFVLAPIALVFLVGQTAVGPGAAAPAATPFAPPASSSVPTTNLPTAPGQGAVMVPRAAPSGVGLGFRAAPGGAGGSSVAPGATAPTAEPAATNPDLLVPGFGRLAPGVASGPGGTSGATGGGTMGPYSGTVVPGGASGAVAGGTMGPSAGAAVPGGAPTGNAGGTFGPYGAPNVGTLYGPNGDALGRFGVTSPPTSPQAQAPASAQSGVPGTPSAPPGSSLQSLFVPGSAFGYVITGALPPAPAATAESGVFGPGYGAPGAAIGTGVTGVQAGTDAGEFQLAPGRGAPVATPRSAFQIAPPGAQTSGTLRNPNAQ